VGLKNNNNNNNKATTPCLKNVPHLARYNFDTCERILISFGKNVTDKVSNQKPFTMPPQITCFCTTWQNRETRKLHFSLKCCISALSEFNQLLDFFNLFDSRLILTLLYDSLSLVINVFSPGLLEAWFRINEVESAAAVGLCCMHNAPVHCLFPISQHNAEALDK